jgi:lysophospholipase L1-like esterase
MKRAIRAAGTLLLAAVVAAACVLALRSPAAAPDTVTAVPEAGPSEQPAALFVGDNFTRSSGAASPLEGYSCQLANAMGWVCNLDGQGDTGFVANGHANVASYQSFIGRLAADKAKYLADIVVIDGGRNDRNLPIADVKAAVIKYLLAVRRAWPQAEIVVITPVYLRGTVDSHPFGRQLAAIEQEAVALVDGHIVDPLGEGWLPGGPGTDYVAADGIHPNPKGHSYIAKRLTKELRRLGLADVRVTDTRRPG